MWICLRRVLIATLISAVFLALYTPMVARQTQSPMRQPALGRAGNGAGATTLRPQEPSTSRVPPLANEELAFLESPDLKVEIGRSSGMVRQVTLKKFMGAHGNQPVRFGSELPLVSLSVGEARLTWTLVEETESLLSFNTADSSGNSYHIYYRINGSKLLINLELDKLIKSDIKSPGVVITSTWSKSDELSGRYNPLEMFLASVTTGGKKSYKRFVAPWRTEKEVKDFVPRGTFLFTISERYFCSSMMPGNEPVAVKLLPSPSGTIAYEYRGELATHQEGRPAHSAEFYIGPRDYFSLKRAGFEPAFPVGAIEQIGLILLLALNGIASVTKNYGIAIVLFSGIVTCLMAPFTLLSFKSMKKMQELKPKMDKIVAQHKDDPKKANQEIFALYREHRVSPLSGCLPMLLQIPVFIALFRAMSHFIELRGKSFLWIADLSLPDRIAQLPFSIPVIGRDVNLLPVIMALAMYLQTKMSQKGMGATEANPSAKMMAGPIMPVMFGVMFYQFPSGLVLYWLTNSLISLVWYRLAK